jgi:hypothetical protein
MGSLNLVRDQDLSLRQGGDFVPDASAAVHDKTEHYATVPMIYKFGIIP